VAGAGGNHAPLLEPNVFYSIRSLVLAASLVFGACFIPDGKDKCGTQADCLSGYLCSSGICTLPTQDDAGGVDSVTGHWNLVVRADYNGNAALRSYHSVLATEEAYGVIAFATPFCTLYAIRTGETVALRSNQSCTVPTGTALSLDQETAIGSGTFSNRVQANAPYCYTIWLSSSTSAPFSGSSYRFFGDGGVHENGNPTAACSQPGATDNTALQFDLSR